MLIPKRCQWVYFIQFLVLSFQLVLLIISLQVSQRKSFRQDLTTRRSFNSIGSSSQIAREENYQWNNNNRSEYLPENHHLNTSQNSSNRSSSKPFLTIIIFSNIVGSDIRNTCRKTWLKDYRNSTKVVHWFVIGTGGSNEEENRNLQRESEQYGDLLLLENHTESYGLQCTEKLILSFQWLAQNSKAEYVMKTDDDSYVRLGLILPLLHERATQTKPPFLYGTIAWYFKPLSKGKWKEENWDLAHEYLAYPLGSGYILPVSIVKGIVQSDNIAPLRKLNNEDVAVGVWIAPYHMDYVDMKRYHGKKEFPCSPGANSTFIIYHCLQSLEMMHSVHNCLYEKTVDGGADKDLATSETNKSTK